MCKIGVEICCFILKLADLNSSNKIGADADGCLKWQPCFRQNGRASRRCSELEHPNLSSRIWELCLDALNNNYPWLPVNLWWSWWFVACVNKFSQIYIYIHMYTQQDFGARISFGEGWIIEIHWFSPEKDSEKNIWMDIPAICSTWDFLLLLKHGRNTWCIHPVSWACFVFKRSTEGESNSDCMAGWFSFFLGQAGFCWPILRSAASFCCIFLLVKRKFGSGIILDVSKHKLHHSDWWNDVEFMILFFIFRFALEVNGLAFSNNVPEIWKA